MLPLIYNTILLLASLLWGPYYIYRALRSGRSLPNIAHRLGFVPRVRGRRPTIWIHAVSVGEVLAARPLVEYLRATVISLELVVSTVTDTGQKIANTLFGHRATVCYFPLDWPWSVRRALRRIAPDLVLIVETEIWPNFLRECRRHNVPVILINGRISERSFRRYRLVKRFLRSPLDSFSYLLMQSPADAQRMCELGAPPDRVKITGNLKWDAPLAGDEQEKVAEFSRLFSLPSPSPLIVAASTGPGEEKIILAAFQRVRSSIPTSPRLVIAPRHPERFDLVERLIQESHLSYVRRSLVTTLAPSSDVILLDTLGELRAFYQFATVAILGGSFLGSAGHNIVEPLVRGCPVIVGPGYPLSALPPLPEGPAPPVTVLPKTHDRMKLINALAQKLIELTVQPFDRQHLQEVISDARKQYGGAVQKSVPYIITTLQAKTIPSIGQQRENK